MRRLVTGAPITTQAFDVTFGLTGRQAESALLDAAGVVTNRNAIRSDPNGAWLRGHPFGTPALTTPGFWACGIDWSQSWWWTCPHRSCR